MAADDINDNNTKSWLIPPGTITEHATEIYHFVNVKELSLICAEYVTCCREPFTHFHTLKQTPAHLTCIPPLMMAYSQLECRIAPSSSSSSSQLNLSDDDGGGCYRGWVASLSDCVSDVLLSQVSFLNGKGYYSPCCIYSRSDFEPFTVVTFGTFDSQSASVFNQCWDNFSPPRTPTADQLKLTQSFKKSVGPLILGKEEWINYHTLRCESIDATYIAPAIRRDGTTTALAVCVAVALIMNPRLSVRVWFNSLHSEHSFWVLVTAALGEEYSARLSHHVERFQRGVSANIDVFDGLHWPVRIDNHRGTK